MSKMCLSPWILVFLLSIVYENHSLYCTSCEQRNIRCGPVVNTTECFPTKVPCGCCYICAGQVGSPCSAFRPRCHPDLVCRSYYGVEKELVKWSEFSFMGTCQHPSLPAPVK